MTVEKTLKEKLRNALGHIGFGLLVMVPVGPGVATDLAWPICIMMLVSGNSHENLCAILRIIAVTISPSSFNSLAVALVEGAR